MSDAVATASAHRTPTLLSHFDDLRQQDDTTKLGMWTFLATEVMFFGGMFLAYILFRYEYHDSFALGSNALKWWAGFLNTGVLLCSSLSMALAVDFAKLGKLRPLLLNLVITMVLGSTFLGVKAYEYITDYHEGLIPGLNWQPKEVEHEVVEANKKIGEENRKVADPAKRRGPIVESSIVPKVQLFFVIYFAMTGLHALHMIIGIVAIAVLAVMIYRSQFADGTTVESLGLYWHFVDLVWVFLFPLLYLIDLNHQL